MALGFLAGRDGEDVRRSVSQSLQAVGGGGAFNGVLKSSGIGDAIASATSSMNVSVVAFCCVLLLSVFV